MSAKILVQAQKVAAGRSRQLVVPIVREQHPRYGLVEVTPEKVARFAENFAKQIKTYHGRLPFGIDHDEGRGAAGWITRVEADDKGLWADIEWTPSGVEAIESQQYPFISPEWRESWTDPRTGVKHADVFEGASLVVRPQFRDLPPATVQHYEEDPAPTVWVFWEAEDDMADEVDKAATPTPAAADAASAAPNQASPEPAADEAQRRFDELQAEVAGLKRERARLQFREEAGGLSFGESGRQRLAPASRDAIAEFLSGLEPEQAAAGMKLFSELRFYEPGERGFGTRPGAAVPQAEPQLNEHERRFSEQLGLEPKHFQEVPA